MILASIFNNDVDNSDDDIDHQDSLSRPELARGILGLDDQHSTLARILIEKEQWSHSELENRVGYLNLMLDGALEQINDAAFDAYDMYFTEGDDPIDVNPDIKEKI
jgi:hypothetical protein